jgi:hypothetical protein
MPALPPEIADTPALAQTPKILAESTKIESICLYKPADNFL